MYVRTYVRMCVVEHMCHVCMCVCIVCGCSCEFLNTYVVDIKNWHIEGYNTTGYNLTSTAEYNAV